MARTNVEGSSDSAITSSSRHWQEPTDCACSMEICNLQQSLFVGVLCHSSIYGHMKTGNKDKPSPIWLFLTTIIWRKSQPMTTTLILTVTDGLTKLVEESQAGSDWLTVISSWRGHVTSSVFQNGRPPCCRRLVGPHDPEVVQPLSACSWRQLTARGETHRAAWTRR